VAGTEECAMRRPNVRTPFRYVGAEHGGMTPCAVLLVAFAGCMPVPYPHKVITHSTISGRVVDAETRAPVPDIAIHVQSDSRSS